MKRPILFALFLFIQLNSFGITPFRFAFITDMHIDVKKEQPSEDLLHAINEINSNTSIEFSIIGGDVTQDGDSASLCYARTLLNQLKKPYYITFGNHDVRTSSPENRMYKAIFGADRFSFIYQNIFFIGFTTAPTSNYGIGHIAENDLAWLKAELTKQKSETTVFVTTHYPLLTGDVDNWQAATAIMQNYAVKAILNGHYHRNAILNYDNIMGLVNRSTLRGKELKGGYSIYTVSDSLSVSEKIIDTHEREWLIVPLK